MEMRDPENVFTETGTFEFRQKASHTFEHFYIGSFGNSESESDSSYEGTILCHIRPYYLRIKPF